MPDVRHRVTKRGPRKRRLRGGRHVGEPPFQHDLDTERAHTTPGAEFGEFKRKPRKKRPTRRVL